jgi:protocatechuate 3,4-dioxygenase beta subunit
LRVEAGAKYDAADMTPTGSGHRLSAIVTSLVAALCVGASDAAAQQTRCTPTPSDGGGPNRATPPLRAKIGSGHVLTGIVLSPTCKPVAGARVSLWQAGRNGNYTAAGRGAVVTDRSGRFRFEGPPPTPYEGRPAHIHIKVEAGEFEPLFTRYEPRGRTRGSIRLVLSPSDL